MAFSGLWGKAFADFIAIFPEHERISLFSDAPASLFLLFEPFFTRRALTGALAEPVVPFLVLAL